MRKIKVFWFLAGWLILFPGGSFGQSIQSYTYNPNDDRFKILALKKAELSFKQAERNFKKSEGLFEKNLISEDEYETSRIAYENAKIVFQQSLLNVVFDKPHITVVDAVKYQTEGGRKRVRLTLENVAGGSFDLAQLKLEDTAALTERVLEDSRLTNIYVSLKQNDVIISSPYEAVIPSLKYHERVQVDFLLLKDLDDVVVAINYADKVEEKHLYLQKDASANIVTVQSSQYSLEADLGSQAVYNLTLERFTSEQNIFKLVLINLPKEITHSFVDPNTEARLTQVKFNEDESSKSLNLILYLPEITGEKVTIDNPLRFYAMVVSPSESESIITSDRLENMDESVLKSVLAGMVELELIPRGVAEIDIVAANLYHQITPNDAIQTEVNVRNAGTRRLDNIQITADVPYGWEYSVDPPVIKLLLPSEESRIQLRFDPGREIGIGDYEIKIGANTVANNQKIEAIEKTLRVHVTGKTNILGLTALLTLLLGLILGVVVFGIKLSRR